jgi:NADH:ubiquinone oxidoreductase subunit C
MNKNSLSIFPFVFKISSILPKFIKSIVYDESKNSQQLSLELFSQQDIVPVLNFLKNHSNSLFLSLAELTAVDWLGSVGTLNNGFLIRERFQLVYILTSHYFNIRIKIVCFLNDDAVALSSCGLFKASN